MESDLVPQTKLVCESDNLGDCLESNEENAVDHAQDLAIECQDSDPTNPNREDGHMEMVTPYSGSSDRYPVVY